MSIEYGTTPVGFADHQWDRLCRMADRSFTRDWGDLDDEEFFAEILKQVILKQDALQTILEQVVKK